MNRDLRVVSIPGREDGDPVPYFVIDRASHRQIAGPFIMASAAREHTMKKFRVLVVQFEPEHTETIREYRASCYAEAFGMAERADAGGADFSYGVPADSFELARVEGIPFNEADGMLLDEDPREVAPAAWPGHVYGSDLTPAERRKANRDEHRARNGRRA